MSRNLLGRLLVASASLALSACGGGDDTFVAYIPPHTAPPPSQSAAALGFETVSAGTSASALLTDFSISFDAASNTYVIFAPVPGTGWFKRPASNPDLQLAYTNLGAIGSSYYSSALSEVAFGLITQPSGVPLSGTATYDAQVAGYTLDSYFPASPTGASNVVGSINGRATLQFDFGAGTLAGHFDPILTYVDTNAAPASGKTISLGSYNFVNTVYGVGKTNFSGQLSISGTSSLGAFDGQFTGPVAQELMARWTAPYLNPTTKQWSEMFGVWVGKH